MVTEADVRKILPDQGFLYWFVRHMYESSDSPLAYALGTALTMVAAVAPAGTAFQFGTKIQPHLWVMLVGTSGGRKGVSPIKAIEILQEHDPDRLFKNAQSSGALVDELAKGSGQFLWVLSELGEFFQGVTKGQHREGLKMMLNNVYDGIPIDNVTRSKGASIALRPRLSLLGAANPSILEEHTTLHDWENGWINRWMIIYARPERVWAIPPTDPPFAVEATKSYLDLMKRVAQMGPCLGWAPEGKAVWDEYTQEKTGALRGADPRIRVALARIDNVALKAAMLHAIAAGEAFERAVTTPGVGWQLWGKDVRFGTAVARMHARSTRAVLDLVPTDAAEATFMRVLRAFRDESGMPVARTLGDLLLLARPNRLNKRQMAEVIETMKLTGEISEVQGMGGGPYYCLGQAPVDPTTGLPQTLGPDGQFY